MDLLFHRWYNKNITRGEAEGLLMKEVKTTSTFSTFLFNPLFSLLNMTTVRISVAILSTFAVTVPPTVLLHLQNECKCTCNKNMTWHGTWTVSYNHSVSSSAEFPGSLHQASGTQNSYPGLLRLIKDYQAWVAFMSFQCSTFREKKAHSWCGTRGRRESTLCQSSPKHRGNIPSHVINPYIK